MKTIRFANGTEVSVSDETLDVYAVLIDGQTPQEMADFIELCTYENMSHVELLSGDEVLSEADNIALASLFYERERSVYAMIGRPVDEEVLDKANGYDILTGEEK